MLQYGSLLCSCLSPSQRPQLCCRQDAARREQSASIVKLHPLLLKDAALALDIRAARAPAAIESSQLQGGGDDAVAGHHWRKWVAPQGLHQVRTAKHTVFWLWGMCSSIWQATALTKAVG